MSTLCRGNLLHRDEPPLPGKASAKPLHQATRDPARRWAAFLPSARRPSPRLCRRKHPMPDVRKARLRHQPHVPAPDDPHPETFAPINLSEKICRAAQLFPSHEKDGCILSLLASFPSPLPTKRAFHVRDSGSEVSCGGLYTTIANHL
jgi:hypothetical protein